MLTKYERALEKQVDQLQKRVEQLERDGIRYNRIRVLGCTLAGSQVPAQGTVVRFQTLDALVDADIQAYPSRGEATWRTG